MARTTKSTRGRQPPPRKPPTKRRRRGTEIAGGQPSVAPESSEVCRDEANNILWDENPTCMQQTGLARSTIDGTQTNGNRERRRTENTAEGTTGMARGHEHNRPNNIPKTSTRGTSSTQVRRPHLGPEQLELAGQDNISLHPETPAIKTSHARQPNLVSSDAETEDSKDPTQPPESQASRDNDRRLIHEAFPQRGGSADRAGIENIRRLAQSSCILDSIQIEIANSENPLTTGFGQYVPLMNTPQMSSEPGEVGDLQTTQSNQGHSGNVELALEDQVEPPYGRQHLFRNRTGERDFGVGLLDHNTTCPTLEEEPDDHQHPHADDLMESLPNFPVHLPSDTQDRRSRSPPSVDTSLSLEDNDNPAPHPPVTTTSRACTLPVVDQPQSCTPLATIGLPRFPETLNPTRNIGTSSGCPNSTNRAAPRSTPQRRRGGRQAARDRGRGRARGGHCRSTAELRPTTPQDATPSTPAIPTVVQSRRDEEEDIIRTSSSPTGATTTTDVLPAATTYPSRARRALSPTHLARVRNLDKVRKRLQRVVRKRAVQLAATGGTGAVSLTVKQVLDLCAGEPQGESHKDLVGALSKIVPTELPCYREIKSVTRDEIGAICKRLAELFSNAQDVLPTWTRKTVGRLLKSRRTRTRRKVKRLMAARSSVRRGQPSPPMPPGVFLVEVEHFVQELLTEEFQSLSKRMTDRSNNMVKKNGCGNKAGAGGYERAKAHISKRDGRPATLRELWKWKVIIERAYEAGPSRTATGRRLAGVTTPAPDADEQSSDAGGSSDHSGSSSSSDPYDSDETFSSDGSLSTGGRVACGGSANYDGETNSDQSSSEGTAPVIASGGNGAPHRPGLDVMPTHWHHPIRGVGAFFDRYVELYGMEPGDRELVVWEANGRPWLHCPT